MRSGVQVRHRVAAKPSSGTPLSSCSDLEKLLPAWRFTQSTHSSIGRIRRRVFACSYPRGSGLGLDLAEYGIGPNMKGKPLELGKSLLRRQGKDAALVGYGSSVSECLAAAEMLAEQGVEVTVCDARFCKPLDTGMVCSQSFRCWRCTLARRWLSTDKRSKRLRIYPYPSGIGLGARGTSGTSRD